MTSLRAAATGLAAAVLTLTAAPLAAADGGGPGFAVSAISGGLGRGDGVEISADASLKRFADSHGDITISSKAFSDFVNVKPGDSTTTVTRCDIKPGTYDVRLIGETAKGAGHTSITVGSSRHHLSCATAHSVIAVGPHSGPKDASAVHPGSKVTIEAGVEGNAYGTPTVGSNAFIKPVKLKELKAGFSGTATLRCDIKPGTYAVELTGPHITAQDLDGEGRTTVKVYPGDETACAHPKHKRQTQAADTSRSGDDDGPSTPVLAASAAGTALLAGAAGYTAGRRRKL
ncbi:hypothetical protein [Streptomyces sp. NPDC048638]|uniref:hypothetical protein n=1 Tax=Streptomyces sp. NPDC048638 TaxID=3365580 RepID=UPI003710B901